MKKSLILLMIMFVVTLGGTFITILFHPKDAANRQDELIVVTSFYPMYIAALNLADGIEDVKLLNLTDNQGGCLHDYQLTTTDMRRLEDADIFIMNGGGMEGYVADLLEVYPDITVIDASEGIELLGETSIHPGESEDEHNHEEGKNAHIWMNPDKYITQIQNIALGLQNADEENTSVYQRNGDAYIQEVFKISDELKLLDAKKLSGGIISFHDAFAYLAQALSIPVIHSVDLDKDTSLSAGEVAEIIDEIEENQVHYIFTEKQLSESSPRRVAQETKAKLCIIDSLVSGSDEKDAYLNGMKENIRILKQVLENE